LPSPFRQKSPDGSLGDGDDLDGGLGEMLFFLAPQSRSPAPAISSILFRYELENGKGKIP